MCASGGAGEGDLTREGSTLHVSLARGLSAFGEGAYSMGMAFTPQDIAELREELAKGGLAARVVGSQLLQLVEHLQAELERAESRSADARMRLEALVVTLEQRLYGASAPGVACTVCAEVLEQLRRMTSAAPTSGSSRGDAAHQG